VAVVPLLHKHVPAHLIVEPCLNHEHGVDSENSPFLKLSILEAIQAVKDGLEDQTLPVEVAGTEVDQ
jgi:hypothetical protein